MTSRSRWGLAAWILVILAVVGSASSADALRHRHRRNHRSPQPTATQPSSGPVTVVPNPIHLTPAGGFTALIVGQGLPVRIPLRIDTTVLEIVCGGRGLASPSVLSADPNGGFVATLASPSGCLAGTRPIMITEQTSPFQTFTVMVELV